MVSGVRIPAEQEPVTWVVTDALEIEGCAAPALADFPMKKIMLRPPGAGEPLQPARPPRGHRLQPTVRQHAADSPAEHDLAARRHPDVHRRMLPVDKSNQILA